MDNWWGLGEGYGYQSDKLAMYQITCPFCLESGNFSVAFHAEKKKPNSQKKLNFDTLECGNCKGYVMVLWSASELSGGLCNHRVLPWPLKLERYPQHWPATAGRYWLQAKRNLRDENWDAAALMARSSLQFAVRDHKAEGQGLKAEIKDLAKRGILPPLMKEWSDNVKELGDETAHPKPNQKATHPEDAKDVIRFLDFLLEYLYTLPHQIKVYRERKNND